MPEAILLLLPVALGVAIAAAAVILLRRTGVVAAESRQAAGARRSVAALETRIVATLDPLIARIDQARRGQIEATSIGTEVTEGQVAVEALTEEARSLAVPAGLTEVRIGIISELERAGRALEMVEHGRSIMDAARLRGRELEAQTAVKRGYLNLLHAREAIERHAAVAATYRSPVEARRDARRTG